MDTNLEPFSYDDRNNIVKYRDYHFFRNSPIKLKNNLGFVLFCILCNINYIIEFLDKYFVEEIPQKFKYAYLQYFSNMSRSLKMKLPRGNSNSVDAIAIEVANKYGAKMLNKVTKTNMTNFKRIKDLI